jgi:hypothetical protein
MSYVNNTIHYKYIIDASSAFTQKNNGKQTKIVFPSLWEKIEILIHKKYIVTCSEIENEIVKDNEIKGWLKEHNCYVIPVYNIIQNKVKHIVNTYPKLLDFSRNKSSGDAFLIATAGLFGLTIITEENKTSPKKFQQ